MSSENPYAYNENPQTDYFPLNVNETGEAMSGSEPRTPFKMSLKHKTGFFGSKKCEMAVMQDRLVVEGTRLNEPIELEREYAKDAVQFKMTRLILKTPN